MSATVDVSPVSGHDQLAVQNDRNLDDIQRTPIVSVHLRRHRQTFSLTRTSQNDSGQLQTTDEDVTTPFWKTSLCMWRQCHKDSYQTTISYDQYSTSAVHTSVRQPSRTTSTQRLKCTRRSDSHLIRPVLNVRSAHVGQTAISYDQYSTSEVYTSVRPPSCMTSTQCLKCTCRSAIHR